MAEEEKQAAGASGEAENAKSPLQEIDYKAVAEAEKARADAAEALIVKNKKLSERNKEDTGLTEERVLELITASKEAKDDSKESQDLIEAQRKVKELESKNAEIARALSAKDSVKKDDPTTHRDGDPVADPKLPENSPLRAYKHIGNGIYSKKLNNGKTMFRNTQAAGNERRTWIE